MEPQKQYIGCLLGLAAGDALGYSIDDKTWEQICRDYGPNGLLGYDMQDDYANITSYTQLCAYACNGLLLSISRGNRASRQPYLNLGLREWTRSQMFYRDPEKSLCWIAKLPAFRRRNCRDARMLDTLRLQMQGAGQVRKAYGDSPGALTLGVAIGLFYDTKRMQPPQIGQLAYDTVALTHGAGEAALCAAVLAYSIAGLIHAPEVSAWEQFQNAIDAVQGQFPGQEVQAVAATLNRAITLSREESPCPQKIMEQFVCDTAARCLAGAMYAVLTAGEDFDSAIIRAVNHSGHSAATGALAGAMLGAILGADALPGFYLESLEAVDALTELAVDLLSATPASGIFDTEWDQKYVQGEPLE